MHKWCNVKVECYTKKTMRHALLLFALLLFFSDTALARPSFRSIRESAEATGSNSDAGWRNQFFSWEEYGIRTTYPESWKDPIISGANARLLPHDNTLGQRKNYLLELIVDVWDTGTQLSTTELETFARENTPSRFREFYWGNTQEVEVAGYNAWNARFSTMTGQREETWISVGTFTYSIGYRARNEEYFETDHFFYEDFLDSVKITPPTSNPNPTPSLFADVSDTHPYAEAIAWAKSTGVIGGYPDGTFQPDRTVNRAEFLKIILEDLGSDIPESAPLNFSDVDSAAWYAPYISLGKRAGIVEGYPDGTFRPEQTVNTAEALKMAYKALNIATNASNGPWYQEFIDHASINNILFEDLDPAEGMKRKDVVWIVWRLSQ